MAESALKEYRSPPVGEVHLGVQFRRLAKLNTFMLSRFVEHIGESSDLIVNEMPEQPPRYETEQAGATQQISFGTQLPSLCFNLMDSDRTQVVSVQADRFSMRWLRTPAEDYVRYNVVKARFLEVYTGFCNWLAHHEVEEPYVEQSEVQYVNFVEDAADPTRYFNFIDLSHFREPEGLNFATSQRLTDKSEIGRLFLEAQTQQLLVQDEHNNLIQKPVLKVFLTFRGRQSTPGLDGTLKHLDRGREAIVQTFTDCLSNYGRSVWGEQERHQLDE